MKQKLGLPRYNSVDLVGALVVILIGLFTLAEAWRYPLGTLQRMGPGFFPVTLGILLSLLGVLLLVTSFLGSGRFSGRIDWRALLAILAGILAFGLLLRPTGLAPAIFALVVVVSFASPSISIIGMVTLAVALVVINVALFAYLLDLPFRILVWPF